MAEEENIIRLAKQIESLTKRDQHLLLKEPAVLDIRRQGANILQRCSASSA
jgi:hypothetical protein